MREFSVQTFLAIFARGMTLFAGFFLIAVVTAWLPERETAVFFLFQSISNALAVLSCFGLETYMLKVFSSGESADNNQRHRVYCSALKVVLIISVACFVVAVIWSYYRPDNAGLIPAIVYLATVPFFGILIMSSEALRGLGHYYRAVTLLGICPPIVTASLLILVTKYGLASQITFATSLLMGYFLPGFVAMFLVFKITSNDRGEYKKCGESAKVLHIGKAFSYFCTTGIQQILMFLPVIIAGMLQLSDDFSSYYVALRVSVIASFVLASLNIFVAPMLSYLFGSGKFVEFEVLTKLVATIAFWSTVVLSVSCFVFGDYVFEILGGSLNEGLSYLLILLFGHVISSAVGSVVYVLIMSGNEKDVRNLYLVALILTLIVSPFVIIEFGIFGAVMVNLIVTVSLNIGAWCAVYYRLRFWILPSINFVKLVNMARQLPKIRTVQQSNV